MKNKEIPPVIVRCRVSMDVTDRKNATGIQNGWYMEQWGRVKKAKAEENRYAGPEKNSGKARVAP